MSELTRHPEEDRRDECHGYNPELPTDLMVFVRLDDDLHILCLEREKEHQQPPSEKDHDDHYRYHADHPCAETDVDIHRCQLTDGNGVRRRTDRRSQTTYVRRNRNRHGEAYTTTAISRQRTEYRRQESQHHRRRSGITHEHRHNTDESQETEQHPFRVGTEGLEHHTRQHHIQAHFASGYCEHETAQEQHNNRIGKGRHQFAEVNQRTHFGIGQTLVRNRQ